MTSTELAPSSFDASVVPLIGREVELARIQQTFASGARLVTLTGGPGMGKTRLALHVADLVARDNPRGVWVCALTDARSVQDAVALLGRVFAIELSDLASSRSIAEVLDRRGGSQLIVFDNLDHLVADAAEILAPFLSGNPKRQLLVTSRERLRWPAEVLVELPPLSLTGRHGAAADLFIARARVAGVEIGSDRESRIAVSEIVTRMEGIPLAIELAAARTRLLGLEGVRRRLDDALDLLGSAPTRRSTTLRGAVEWSWRLLSPEDRDFLARASVFRGGFDIDAAAAVTGLSVTESLDRIEALADRSLLRFSALSGGGERRFSLHFAIREFGAEMLRLDETARRDAHLRHAAYFADRAVSWEAADVGSLASAMRRNAALERENVLAAITTLFEIEPGDAEVAHALRLCLTIEHYFQREKIDAFSTYVDRTLTAAELHDVEPALRARLYVARADRYETTGRAADALADNERALALARRMNDTFTEAIIEGNRALTSLGRGNGEEAIAQLGRAIALHVAAKRTAYRGVAEALLGYAYLQLDRREEARATLDRALDLLSSVGDHRWRSAVHRYLGQLHLENGEFDHARASFEDSLGAAEESADQRTEMTATAALAAATFEAGRLEESAQLYADAVDMMDRLPVLPRYYAVHAQAAALFANLGMLDVARERLVSATSLCGSEELDFQAILQMSEQHLALATARAAAEPAAIAKARELAYAVLAEREKQASSSSSSWQRTSIRLLRRTLAWTPAETSSDKPGRGPSTPGHGALADGTLVVNSGGGWALLPSGVRVELGRRPVLSRLVRALAEQRVQQPGVVLSIRELALRMWPGQELTTPVAANRIYYSVNTLRGAGFEGLIESPGSGYRLTMSVAVRLEP